MTKLQRGIATGNPPQRLLEIERDKSKLLLEAQLLRAQQRFVEAADKFARAAELERAWVEWATEQGLTQLAFLHGFSEVSCWAQAGDTQRATMIGRDMQRDKLLDPQLRQQLDSYMATLESRRIGWMNEWVPAAITTD